MKRTAIAAVTLGCSTVGLVPALAASPPAETGRFATTDITAALPGGDSLEIDLRGGQFSDGSRLTLDVQRCGAGDAYCDPSDYASALPSGALSVDSATAKATLRTVLGGQPLVIQWQPTGSRGVVLGGGQFVGSGLGASGTTYMGDPATVSVQLGDASCHGRGAVGNGAAVDVGSDGAAPTSALHLPGDLTLHC